MGFSNGLDEEKDDFAKTKERMLEEMRRTFRPEFLNRIDEIIVFHPLNEEHISQIVDLMMKDLRTRLAEKNMQLEFTAEAKEKLIKEGYDPEYGARPLRRALQSKPEIG